MALLTFLLTVIGFCSSALAWHYPESRGDGWPLMCESGMNQSPIDVETKHVINVAYEPLIPIYYNTPVTYNLTNNGHTFALTAQRGCQAAITGGNLRHLYLLDNIHIHWGSEHTIDGKRLLLEVHFVHYDTRYRNIAEALKSPRGIAVVGVLFHESENDIPNPEIAVLLNTIRQVAKTEGSVRLPNDFAPSDLLPSDTGRWWRYHGSLTTPSCDESVVWTVMEDTLPISNEQVAHFQELVQEGVTVKNNARETKPLHGRPLYYQHPSHQNGGAFGVHKRLKLASILPILAALLSFNIFS